MENFFYWFLAFLGVCLLVAAYLWVGIFLKRTRYKVLQKLEPDNPDIEVLMEPHSTDDGSGTRGMRMIIAQKKNSKTFFKSDWEKGIDSALYMMCLDKAFKKQYHCVVKAGVPLGIYRIQYRHLPDTAVDAWFNRYDPQHVSFDMDFETWKGATLQCKWVDTTLYVLFDKSTPFDDETDVVYEDIPKVKL